MKKTKRLLSTALASAVLFGIASFQVTNAAEVYVSKAKVKTLYKAPLQGVEGKEMVVKHFGLPAEFVGGKHMHPGPVFVYVLEGELTVELASETKTFKAGELYAEDINTAMVGKNLSATDDLEILVFQVGDVGKPMMLKVK
ncbi:MAG: cupin domain-containing protein [Gammaproteobacteria bacterium]|nr:MAG: cupin domain-containing protein [Gammaproteobacteria bacterium]